jgi:hypothetical protein
LFGYSKGIVDLDAEVPDGTFNFGRAGAAQLADDARATPQDLDTLAIPDEQAWLSQRQGYLCY